MFVRFTRVWMKRNKFEAYKVTVLRSYRKGKSTRHEFIGFIGKTPVKTTPLYRAIFWSQVFSFLNKKNFGADAERDIINQILDKIKAPSLGDLKKEPRQDLVQHVVTHFLRRNRVTTQGESHE